MSDTPELPNESPEAGLSTPTTEPSPPLSDPAAVEPYDAATADREHAEATARADERRASLGAIRPPPSESEIGRDGEIGSRFVGKTDAGLELHVFDDPDELVGLELVGEGDALEVFTMVGGDRRLAWRGDKATRTSVELPGGARAILEAR